MKQRFRLYRRNGGIYYIHDDKTGKQESLHTRDRAEASALFAAKTQAAPAGASESSSGARPIWPRPIRWSSTRTWQLPMDELAKPKRGPTQDRWQTAIKDKAFDLIRHLPILETQAGTFSASAGNRHGFNQCLSAAHPQLRPGHGAGCRGRCVVKRHGRPSSSRRSAAITWEEHQAIVAREQNPERKAFYKLAWHLGASQSDLAFLEAENIDWEHHVISFARKKTGSIAIMRFDEDVAEILRDLPGSGPLFPYLRTVRAGDRATEFKQRCDGLGIKGVTLHSYRYAWAERAKTAGYPERFAQESLGHNSKAVHRAYARKGAGGTAVVERI